MDAVELLYRSYHHDPILHIVLDRLSLRQYAGA